MVYRPAQVLGAGDSYLNEQVRRVLEQSGSALTADGEVPHHFIGASPTYSALSHATMPGPNCFWVRTCLRYADMSGNITWLRGYLPTMRSALDHLRRNVNRTVGLLRSPGSLFIDVFDRHGFVSDSNAMLVGLLADFAGAEAVVGNAANAATLLRESARLRAAMQRRLWAAPSAGADHFVTALLDDNVSIYDMIDYDANLIAVAHNTPADDALARRVVRRVDSGKCTAVKGAGPQFVSEGCYDTNHPGR